MEPGSSMARMPSQGLGAWAMGALKRLPQEWSGVEQKVVIPAAMDGGGPRKGEVTEDPCWGSLRGLERKGMI